jgi:hypothetical protein
MNSLHLATFQCMSDLGSVASGVSIFLFCLRSDFSVWGFA